MSDVTFYLNMNYFLFISCIQRCVALPLVVLLSLSSQGDAFSIFGFGKSPEPEQSPQDVNRSNRPPPPPPAKKSGIFTGLSKKATCV